MAHHLKQEAIYLHFGDAAQRNTLLLTELVGQVGIVLTNAGGVRLSSGLIELADRPSRLAMARIEQWSSLIHMTMARSWLVRWV